MKGKRMVIALCAAAAVLAGAGVLAACAGGVQPAQALGQLEAPADLVLERRTLSWSPVANAEEYVILINGEEEQRTEACMADLLDLAGPATYTISVSAVGEGYTPFEGVTVSLTLGEAVAQYYDESGLLYRLLSDGTGYSVHHGRHSLEGDVVIQSFVGDYPVKELAENAFSSTSFEKSPFDGAKCYDGITSVTLPDYLTTIREYALACLISVEELYLPDSVTEMERRACWGMRSLKRVHLPANLKEIPGYCFSNTALEEITLPQGLESIGEGAFYNAYTEYEEGYVDLSFLIPGYGYYVYNHIRSDLQAMTIPASVNFIGRLAFYGRKNLTGIVLEGMPAQIESKIMHETAWYEAQAEGFVYLKEGLLYNYKGECGEQVVIPSDVKQIAGGAFINQKALRELYIPDGVSLSGALIFDGCSQLDTVRLPDDLKEIPQECFSYTALAEIVLPQGLESIGYGAFMACDALTRIEVPASVREIDGYAFANCEALAEIVLHEGLTTIGDSAFRSCPVLTEITLPQSLRYIGKYAFQECNYLSKITIPQNVAYIGGWAFSDCVRLNAIYFEDPSGWVGVYALSVVSEEDYMIACSESALSNPYYAADYMNENYRAYHLIKEKLLTEGGLS